MYATSIVCSIKDGTERRGSVRVCVCVCIYGMVWYGMNRLTARHANTRRGCRSRGVHACIYIEMEIEMHVDGDGQCDRARAGEGMTMTVLCFVLGRFEDTRFQFSEDETDRRGTGGICSARGVST